jgi:hypothetical protein
MERIQMTLDFLAFNLLEKGKEPSTIFAHEALCMMFYGAKWILEILQQ